MTKLPNLSGLLSEALEVDPVVVDKHAKGLVGAGRIDPEAVQSTDAADLLLACINTDPTNATGLFHLPFAGACKYVEGVEGVEVLGPGHPQVGAADAELGDMLTSIITAYRDANPRMFVFDAGNIQVSGRGHTIRANLSTESEGITVIYWYGYELLPDLFSLTDQNPTYMERTNSISGGILRVLSELLEGQLPELIGTPSVRDSVERRVN